MNEHGRSIPPDDASSDGEPLPMVPKRPVPPDGQARGPLADPRVANPLDLESIPGDRVLLGLPAQGALMSGQIEVALAARLRDMSSHPLGSGHKAARLRHLLEDAADRLQAELALAGRGPLHPAAAARAARRLAAERGGSARTAVSSPIESERRRQGVAAEDLTEFDRLALAVLVVSRGWNATSAKRLAAVAADFGVEVEELERVVAGLTRFLAEGGSLHRRLGEVGTDARASMFAAAQRTRSDRVEGAVERAFHRIDEALREQMHDDSRGSQARLAAVFGLFALSWIGVLAYVFFAPAKESAIAEELASSAIPALAPESPAASRPAGPTGANGEAIAPPPTLAAPAKFPRPPGFTPSETPRTAAEAASSAASWIADLEGVARALQTNRGRLDGRNLALVSDGLSAAAGAWPAAPGRRAELLRAFGDVARQAMGSDSLRNAMQAVPGSDTDLAAHPGAEWTRVWRRAFGAGVLASVALDPSQSPEAVTAAREEMRLRQIAIPRTDTPDPFATCATTELVASAPRLAERLALGTSELEDASRWAEAVASAATAPSLKRQTMVAAIDASLRAPGALDKPGPLVDFLAYAIQQLDFTGRGDDAEPVRNALAGWLVDRAIPPSRIWVFTSLLDQDLGIAWYGPDLVAATDASQAAREQLSERVLAAFPRVEKSTMGEAIVVAREAFESWKRGVAAVDGAADTSEYLRIRNAAMALSLARAAKAFETGDAEAAARAIKAAETLAAREATEWMASPNGDRFGLEASGVNDGEFSDAYLKLGRDVSARVDLIRSLGARPASGDLGPIDARTVVNEALRGTPQDVRAAAATVLVDRYSRGREVLRAALDALADGTASSDAPDFVSQMVGAQVAGADWQSEARTRILELMFMLSDAELHAANLAAAELVAGAVDLAAAHGASAPAISDDRPDRALAALADALRNDAANRFLAAPFPQPVDEIERMRLARRSVARGLAQRMAAETPAIVAYAAMLSASRQPALESKIAEMLARGRKLRSTASTASAQVEADMVTLLEVLGAGLAPEATRRDEPEGGKPT